MRLVKEIKTNQYQYIKDEEFDSSIHVDLSDSIYHFAQCGNDVVDYIEKRRRIKEIVDINGWDSIKYKDIVVDFCATSAENVVVYFMEKGLSQAEAERQYAMKRIIDVQNAGACYCQRVKNPELQLNIIIFLGEEQGSLLNNALATFKSQLCEIALLGTDYGDSRDGIMNFIKSSGGYVDGGLKSFTFTDAVISLYGSEDEARLELINIFEKYLIDGGYQL